MTTHISEEIFQVQAGADLSGSASRYKVVLLNGTIAAAAAVTRLAGILKYGNNSGYNCGVVYDGITKAIVGGAVSTLGWPLKVANSGFLIAAASGDNGVCARLWGETIPASGDVAQVLCDFTGAPGYLGGI